VHYSYWECLIQYKKTKQHKKRKHDDDYVPLSAGKKDMLNAQWSENRVYHFPYQGSCITTLCIVEDDKEEGEVEPLVVV
jgi:hypothetical protein